MRLRDSVDGDTRFEGDRALRWRSIPANARIVSAKATVKPIDAGLGSPFAEPLSFNGGTGDFGATRVQGTATLAGTPAQVSWVEVDFHNRRTLASVTGGFADTSLQVDVGGGTYVEINTNGAFRTPGDPLLKLTGNSAALPALTVAKLKLTNTTVNPPSLTSLTIRSVPTNVSLRLGDLPPFWTHLGEMTQLEITPDFTAVLQAALTSAKVESGFYDLPLVLHSDAIARLQVELEVEFLAQVNPLPQGLQEVVLPFDFSTLPQSTAAVLNVAVPPNTRVVPGQTTARVRGAFAETRVAYGPTGAVTPAASIEVSAACSQAQIVALEKSVSATAVDLLIGAVTPTARLRLDLRGDLDGKPDDNSLLPGPVEFKLDQEAGKAPRWTSVPLPAEFLFAERTKQRYWLVLQSLEGKAAWSVAQAPGAVSMQCNRDGGLSWRDTVASGVPGPVTAFFRLRRRPERFEVPIELQVGDGEQAVRAKLDRFAPLGRVDFALDFDEVAQAFNKHLDKVAPPGCPETEHLANGDFETWHSIGEKLGEPGSIPLEGEPTAIAVAPDGRLAYIGMDDQIKLLDTACDLPLDDEIDIGGVPSLIEQKPDGSRAYVMASGNFYLMDLSARRVLETPLELMGKTFALSPDGRSLYVLQDSELLAVATAELEQAVVVGRTVSKTVTLWKIEFAKPRKASALAVAPDGRRLYVAISKDSSEQGEVQVHDSATGGKLAAADVGKEPSAIALTPDGKWVLVANAGDDSLSVIDAVTSTVIRVINLGQDPNMRQVPIALAVSPDTKKAYVANSVSNAISVIDLTRWAVVDTIPLINKSPTALALTPQGDRVYVVTDDDNSSLISIQVGTRLPAEWSRTSGLVTPVCWPDPFHLVAVLGFPLQAPKPMPTALSQVVPVAESCPYEFGFWGIASEPDAMAEVLWLSRDCGLLRMDQVPIQVVLGPENKGSAVRFFAHVGDAVAQRPPLVFHRQRLIVPEGADQAEVRFSVPAGVVAVIDMVSLIATAEVVSNADFKLLREGRLADWILSPSMAPGVSVLHIESGIRLQNASAATAELVQTVAAKSNQPFTLEFQGKAVAGAGAQAQANPCVELRWLKADGAATGSLTSIEILPAGLGSSVASGTAPADATLAEIHLIAPAGTTQEIKRVSLRFLPPTTVPVTFIAQAPGELTLSDVRIAFEQVEASLPPVPDRGLCVPTPPGHRPGETPGDCCFCHHCESEQTMIETKSVVTPADRPALAGRCATCGTELVRPGGPRVPGAQLLSLRRLPVRSPVLHPTTLRAEAAPVPPLTAMAGIGERRARQLAEIGIISIEGLAAAAPEDVARAMKGVSVKNAANFIGRARQLLASVAKPRAKAMHPFL